MTDEAELIERFQQQRDYAAFEVLFAEHKQALFGFLFNLCGVTSIAEDISQHCWLRVIEMAKNHKLEASKGLRPLLMTMARNRYLDEHVKRQGARVMAYGEQHDAASESASPESVLTQSEQRAVVTEAVKTLPMEQREVIGLWSSGVSIADMIKITGAARDTVLSRKKYALKKLKSGIAIGD